MAAKVTLKFLNGSYANQAFDYEKATKCIIGRQPECTINFPPEELDTGISGKHCLIEINPPQVTVQDLGSTNGTFIEHQGRLTLLGKRGQPQPSVAHTIESGDILKIGDIKIEVVISNIAVTPSPQPTPAPQPTPNPSPKQPAVQTPPVAQPSPQPNKPPAGQTPQLPKKPVNIPPRIPVAPTALKGASRAGWGAARVWDNAKGKLRDLAENEAIEQLLPWVKVFNDNNADLPKGIRNHTIHGSLGKGRYGEVFLASNDQNQIVALKKMFDGDMHKPEIVQRFDREMANLEDLDHRNVVRFLNRGIYLNNNFYTMEYCELGDLNGLIEYMRGPLPLDIAKMVILQVLDGLTYIHKEAEVRVKTKEGNKKSFSLVHRDLKPSNILLRNDGINLVAKVGDFGLSKALGINPDVAIALTQDDNSAKEKLGTYEFMCRRQLASFSKSGPEVDVWAAVACLYYMLTGYPPRDFSKSPIPENVVFKQDAVPILDRNPYINPELAQVINEALWENPDDENLFKYRTAADLKQALINAFP